MPCFILRQRHFHHQSRPIRILAFQSLEKIRNGGLPFFLIELCLAEIKISVGVRRFQLYDGGEVPVRNFPPPVLRRHHTRDYMCVDRAGIAGQHLLRKRSGTVQVTLAKCLIRAFQQRG